MARRARAITRMLAACAAVALLLAPASGAATPRDLALALRLRPRLLFDLKERWRPLDVERFLAEPGHAACPAPGGGGACTPLTSVAQLTPAVAYLDLRGTRADGGDATAPDLATCARSAPSLRDCDEDGRSAIYAHVVRTRTRIAIDYWWFLRYNAYSFDLHEGDWEGVTVITDRTGRRVLEVHFSAHGTAWRYDRGVPSLLDGRVAVYLARGDHAAYPRRCTRFCRGTDGTLPEARFGGERAWVGNAARGCRGRCVRLLPAAPDGAPASWDAWPGRWGVTREPAFPPPLTPSAQPRFRHPFAARRSDRHAF